jgi:muramoyltetrapeptide carboxypeptidase
MPVSPPFLKPGDTVLIVATARFISREEVASAQQVLEGWGFKVELAPDLFRTDNQYGGTDAHRAACLQWALDHPEASAMLLARGGYGTLRIIDHVSFAGFEKKPKWMCGFSDATVLHSHLHRLGYCSLHSPMVNTFLRDRESTLSLKALLSGEKIPYEIAAHEMNVTGRAEGELIGGNLSVLYALSGSVSEMNFRNKILFLEDLDEYLYHIDRMMMQLKRSGKLERIAGLVVGGFSEMKDNKVPFGKNAEEIILEAVREYGYPVCFGFPAGHEDVNMAFYHGKRVKLEVGAAGTHIHY